MVLKIALTSNGPLSGKSTLAKYLESAYDFIRVDHSRTLVEAYVENYNEVNLWPITIEDVYSDKEMHRPALQAFGYNIGYNQPMQGVYWVQRTLQGWLTDTARNVVFDSFRGEQQGKVLRDLGFTLVQIEIGEGTRAQRARDMGKSYDDVQRAMQSAPELELGIRHPDLVLRGELPTELMANALVERLMYHDSVRSQLRRC